MADEDVLRRRYGLSDENESPYIKPPPKNWKSELKGDMRSHSWKYAAGQNDDGSEKTVDQHKAERVSIRQQECRRVAILYREIGHPLDDQPISKTQSCCIGINMVWRAARVT